MLSVVTLQFAAVVLVSVVAGWVSGLSGFFSALLGGLCGVVPNSLFALRLFVAAQTGNASAMVFFVWESIKIMMTVAALAAVVWLYRDLNMLAMIAAFVVVLKSYIILLFRY